jgi:hypothetical protein
MICAKRSSCNRRSTPATDARTKQTGPELLGPPGGCQTILRSTSGHKISAQFCACCSSVKFVGFQPSSEFGNSHSVIYPASAAFCRIFTAACLDSDVREPSAVRCTTHGVPCSSEAACATRLDVLTTTDAPTIELKAVNLFIAGFSLGLNDQPTKDPVFRCIALRSI